MTREQLQPKSVGRWARVSAWLAALLWLMAAPAQSRADDEVDELGDDASAAADDKSSESDDAAADSGETQAEPVAATVPPAAAAEAGPAIAVRPFAGAGWTTRSYERPIRAAGAQALGSSPVPALEAGLLVEAWPAQDFSLAFLLHYQTSIGLVVKEQPPFALPNEVNVRSERVALSITPSWRLGSGELAPRLAATIGATARTFWPYVHRLQTPGYSLIGPHLRAELVLAFNHNVTLRLGPELHWVILIDQSIRTDGVSQQGVGLGGEALLQFSLTQTWALGVHYRESHVLASTTGSVTFTDVERYMTARLMGTF